MNKEISSKKTEIEKSQTETTELKNTITALKNSIEGLISRQDFYLEAWRRNALSH